MPDIYKVLEKLKKLPSDQPDKSKLKEQVSTILIDTNVPFSKLDMSPVFDYKIFPENIMLPFCEWEKENLSMRKGDVIVQQVYFPEKSLFSLKMIFGVRITQIIDQPDKKGFSYVTLPGHAETGISTFTLEKQHDQIIFKIHTFSLPGNLISRLLSPITNKFQYKSTQAALLKVKQQLEDQLLH